MDRQLKPVHIFARIDEMGEAAQLEALAATEQALQAQQSADEFQGLRVRLDQLGAPYFNTEDALRTRNYLRNKLGDKVSTSTITTTETKPEYRKTFKKIAKGTVVALGLAATLGGLGYAVYKYKFDPTSAETWKELGENPLTAPEKWEILDRLNDGFDQNCDGRVAMREFIDLSYEITGVDLAERWRLDQNSIGARSIHFYASDEPKGKGASLSAGFFGGYAVNLTLDTAREFAEKLPEGHCELFR